MVEVPEYLLERSKERRAALGGGSGDSSPAAGAESSPPTDGDAGSAEPALVPAAPSAGKVPQPIAPAPPPPEVSIPSQVAASQKRSRIPYWVMPVLLFLPIWAFIYVGTLEAPARSEGGILGEGSHVYAEVAACASCHGPSGGGTNSGPSIKDIDLLVTFPDDPESLGLAQQIEWVAKATDGIGVGRPYGSPEQGRVAGWFGTMAGFGEKLTAHELLAVVLHERAVIAESETARTQALQIEEALETGTLVLPEYWSPDITVAEILSILDSALADSE